MADNTVRGRFVWHELMTPNVAGAHEFYSTTLGWKTQAWEQDPSYQMFAAPSGPLGAAVETRTGAPQWVPYVGTIDVDATTAAATGLGGRVAVPPADISNAGRYALLADPHGATFGVHSSAAEPEPDTLPHYGQFSWHELATTTDPKSAFAFYAALFGWEEMSQFDMGPMGMYLIFGRNGTQLGGMFNKGDMGKSGPAYWVGYVRVKNVDATLKKVVGARGALLTGPMEVPGGDRIAQFMDPYGAFFAAHSLAADIKAAPAVKKAPKKAPKKSTKKAAKKAANKAAKKAPKRAAAKAAKAAPRKAAKKRAKKRAKKKAVGKKSVAKRGRKVVKKAARKQTAKTTRAPAAKKKKAGGRKGRPKARRR